MNKKIDIISLAFAVALLPPIWAVFFDLLGWSTGPVALIVAGYFSLSNKTKDDMVQLTCGLLCGDLWAVIATAALTYLPWNREVTLFVLLFVMGALVVLIGSALSKYISIVTWLGGWAIGLTCIGPLKFYEMGSLPIQVAVAMVVGIFYVGIGVEAFQKLCIKLINKIH